MRSAEDLRPASAERSENGALRLGRSIRQGLPGGGKAEPRPAGISPDRAHPEGADYPVICYAFRRSRPDGVGPRESAVNTATFSFVGYPK